MYWWRSLFLFLLLISLGVIYSLTTPDIILLVVLCLIFICGVALLATPGDIGFASLGGLTLVMSIGAAALVGFSWNDMTGAILLPFVWVLFVYVAWWMMWREITVVRNLTILLTRSPFYTYPYPHKGPTIIPPLRRLFLAEQDYALLPIYELVSLVRVEKINTSGLQNIMGITTEIRYHIDVMDNKDLTTVIQSFLNHGEHIEDEFHVPLHQAMLQTAFWERLIDKKLREICDSLLRTIVYKHIAKAVEASEKRQTLADDLCLGLQKRIDAWEIKIRIDEITIPTIDLDPEQIKRKFKTKGEENEENAKMEATKIQLIGDAQAKIQAQAIKEWIVAIQQSGATLSADQIEKIVFNALEKLQERQRLEIEMMSVNPAPTNNQPQPPTPLTPAP